MRLLQLIPVLVLGFGCKVIDQPKRVDGLEQRVDELADAVSKLVGEPVAQRPKAKAKHADDDEVAAAGKDAKSKKRAAKDPRTRARRGEVDDAADHRASRKGAAAADEDDARPASKHGADDEDDDDRPVDKHAARAADEPAEAAADDDHPADVDRPAAHAVHWAYAGAQGPKRWGDLDPAYEKCEVGAEQSPVDILPRRRGDAAESVFFVYQPTDGKVVDNGHTLQVELAPGSYAIVDGGRYDLVQFHIHTPSEHTIAGEPYAMEVHLVHKNKAGQLAVVGVMFTEGEPSAAMAAVWKQAPKTGATSTLKKKFDPATLLPTDTAAYRYAGSLTTPPCSEGVRWIVMRRTRTDAAAKIAAFQSRFGGNARPTQPLGERAVE